MTSKKTARIQVLCEPELKEEFRIADRIIGNCHNGTGSESRFCRVAGKEKLLRMKRRHKNVDWSECGSSEQ